MRNKITALLVGTAVLTITLTAGPASAEPVKQDRSSAFRYSVTVLTGNRALAGTNTDLFMYLRGSEGWSPLLKLSGKGFLLDQGQLNTYVFELPSDLGIINRVCVQRQTPQDEWFLETVRVNNATTATFNKWISGFEAGKLMDCAPAT